MTTAEKMKKIPPAPTWDLESIFSGGSASEDFKKFRTELKTRIEKAEKEFPSLKAGLSDSSQNNWVSFILEFQSIIEDVELVISFASMCGSQDVTDSEAGAIESEGFVYLANWEKMEIELQDLASKQSDDSWAKLVNDERLLDIKFFLNELREKAKLKMPVEMESLAVELSTNGYHTWDQLYTKIAGDLKVDFEEDGKVTEMSLGQLATKMSDSDRAIRKQAFEKMSKAWESRQDLAAIALNSLAGFRLSLYDRRGWESAEFEPLKNSRMQQKTLDTMWKVIKDNLHRLKPYVDAKKKLLNIDKFSWYDQFAPCGTADKLYAYDEASDFIYKNLKTFSSDMAEFAKMAIDKRWIEAEDRANKRGGGYCTGTGK
ncbi:MAG: oligoendopeptidase, partial [Calditrichaeota bacterium]